MRATEPGPPKSLALPETSAAAARRHHDRPLDDDRWQRRVPPGPGTTHHPGSTPDLEHRRRHDRTRVRTPWRHRADAGGLNQGSAADTRGTPRTTPSGPERASRPAVADACSQYKGFRQRDPISKKRCPTRRTPLGPCRQGRDVAYQAGCDRCKAPSVGILRPPKTAAREMVLLAHQRRDLVSEHERSRRGSRQNEEQKCGRGRPGRHPL